MRFASVTIASPNPVRLARAYADLGFPVEGTTLGAGATRIHLVERPDAAPVHLAFNVPAHRFADAKAWIASRAPLLEDEGRDEVEYASWDARACYFRDADGNVMELIARRRLPSTFEGPFGAGAIERVSEVGLPVEDVLATVARLTAELGEPPFQEPHAGFGPVGDDHGLLIVVRRGRTWFPSDAAAAGAPLRVTLENGRDVPLR